MINRSAVLVGIFFPVVAFAQYAPVRFPSLDVPTQKAFEWQPIYVGLYPAAEFRGFVGSRAAGTDPGQLIAVEAPFKLKSSRIDFAIGGWAFRYGSSNLEEFHVKAFITPRVGVQVGTLGTNDTSGRDVDGFLLYQVPFKPRTVGTSTLEFLLQGAGGFYSFTSTANSSQPSGFANASLLWNSKWSLDLSYWYLKTPAGHYDRLAAGIGIRI
jgi:hypothetical protein